MTSRRVPTPTVWGIGTVGSDPWPVSPEDITDETESAVEHLRLLGIREGGLVLIVSRLAETIHVAPLELAAGRLNARWSSCDATEGDAFRTASLIRQLRPDAVIGVSQTIVDAVAPDAFDEVPVVAVTDRAARLALPSSRWWLRLGPTSGFECSERAGVHYDTSKWRIEEAGDGVTITNIAPRLTASVQLPIDGRVHVVEGTCACGREGTRVVPA